MAVPVVQSFATSKATSTSVVASLPSGVTDGDLLLAFVSCVRTVSAITPPVGWDLVDEWYYNSNYVYGIYKRIANSEPGSYTWNFSNSGGQIVSILRITDYRTAQPITELRRSGSGSSPIYFPYIVPNDVNSLMLFFGSGEQPYTFGTPSLGSTKIIGTAQGSGSSGSCQVISTKTVSTTAPVYEEISMSGNTYNTGVSLCLASSGTANNTEVSQVAVLSLVTVGSLVEVSQLAVLCLGRLIGKRARAEVSAIRKRF